MRLSINEKYENKDFASINYGGKRVDIYISAPTMTSISYDKAPLTCFNDVFTNNVHVSMSASIVKHISGMGEVVTDDKGNEVFKAHRSASACQDIVNSGYTQPIFEDIVQAIAETLINWYANDSIFGVCKVDTNENKLVFGTYTNKKGIEKSYYNKLYGVVESVLYQHSKHASPNGQALVGVDTVIDCHDGKETILTPKSTRYALACSYDGAINEVIRRKDFQSFVKYASTSKLVSKTTMRSFLIVLYMVLDGKKLDDIASASGLGIATVKRRKADIKAVYESWLQNGGRINISIDNGAIFYGCTSMVNNGASASGGGYFDDMGKKPIFHSNAPLVGALTLNDSASDSVENYASDSVVVIKDKGKTYHVYYRTIIDIDGVPTNNDIFIHEVAKH